MFFFPDAQALQNLSFLFRLFRHRPTASQQVLSDNYLCLINERKIHKDSKRLISYT